MEYKVGDQRGVRINRIQENGCFCSFHPLRSNLYGFMPKYLMPSMIDAHNNYLVSVGDDITAVIYKITDNRFLLSDVKTYENLRFVSEYEVGTIFEAEVIRVRKENTTVKVGNFEGIIEKKDTNWNAIESLDNSLFEGEIMEVVYLRFKDNQLFFSTKLLNEKPYDEKLYDLSLEELLKYIGHKSNEFIGQAKQYGSRIFIENLYSCDDNQKGKLLIDPIYGYNLRALVLNSNFGVDIDHFYKIKLQLVNKEKRLERNQLFQFYATDIVDSFNPYKADVDLTFEKSMSPRDCSALAHTLAEVGKNMYSSKDRMFFELIQNADDAASEKGVFIKVKTDGDFLLVQHNGNSFDKDDFDAITSSANGTKKANENKTGYKGIGFKSVFTDSEIVYIKTGGYQFKFDKHYPIFNNFESFYFSVNGLSSEQQKASFLTKFSSEYNKFRGVADIPWQLEPIWVDSFPEQFSDSFVKSNVAIALKIGENKILGDNGYCKAIDDIISNPKFMLFLRNTKRIDFNGKTVSKGTKDDVITLKNSFKSNKVELFKRIDFLIDVNNDVFEKNNIDVRIKVDEKEESTGKIIEAKFVDIHNQEIENIPKKIAINNATTISFAISIDENGMLNPDSKCSDISLFAFLPTLVKDFKFPFFINANFILDPPRQRILGDNPWNFYLMQEIARRMVSWCAVLNERKDYNALNILVTDYFDESTADTKQLAVHFNTAYKTALETESFILGHNGELKRQDEIMLDLPGLSKLIGADLYCKILNHQKYLPSSNIDSSVLRKKIFEKVEKIDLEDTIVAITDNAVFNNWFVDATNEQKNTFFRWLNWIKDKGFIPQGNCFNDLILSLPLFQFGNQYKSCKEVESEKYIISTEHIVPVCDILAKLSFKCSDNVFDENHPLYGFIPKQDEEALFKLVKESDFSLLDKEEKKTLFFALKEFDKVGLAKLKEVAIFKNLNGNFKPLSEMAVYNANCPLWLNEYVICEDDYSRDLDEYLIQSEDVFNEVIKKHYQDFDVSFSELYKLYQDKDWGQFTRQLIDHYEINDDILLIVEESDTKTKEYFLNSIKKLDLLSTSTYKKNSYEYRVLKLALSVLEDPSAFSPKVYYDGQCITSISVSDDVTCMYRQDGETKKAKMSLAKLLPQYQNQSAVINKIKALFETKNLLDKFFKTEIKPLYSIVRELESENVLGLKPGSWPCDKGGNAYQYLFYVYYYREQKGYTTSYVISIDLSNETDLFIVEMMDFLYDNKIDIETSPFTYRIKQYFTNKFFYSDYIFAENEQLLPAIEKWADNDKKKKYLTDNGVRESMCQAVLFRKLFLANKPIDFIDNLNNDDIRSGIEFFATVSGYKRPFDGDNQINILLKLKDNKFCRLESKFDLDRLTTDSEEWYNEKYNEWVKNHYLRIYVFDGDMPMQLWFDNSTLVAEYTDNEIKYFNDKNTKKLFIIDTDSVDDILFEAARDNRTQLNLDDYKYLCLGKKTKNDEDIEIGLGDDNDKPYIEAQLEAQKRLMDDFPEWTFPEMYGKSKEDGTLYYFSISYAIDEDGNKILFVLKSYKKQTEPFKINTNEWEYLIKQNANLFVYTGRDIVRILVEDLIKNQRTITISFSTINLNIDEYEERVNAFADSLHYFKELHFDFNSFNISKRAESVREIYNKNKQILTNTNNTEDDI